MENMEVNDIITNEAIEEITEVVPTGNSGLKTVAKIGVIGATSIAIWELAMKLLRCKIKNRIIKKKTARKIEKAEEEVDLDDMEIDEIPELEE